MGRFAEGTKVSQEKTQAEIIDTLKRYGATDHLSGENSGGALVCFVLRGYSIRMNVAMPKPDEKRFVTSGRGRRTPRQATNAYQAEVRRRWRSLLLRIKARLEAVADGDVSVAEEFMPWLVTGTGQTVYEQLVPQLHDITHGQPLRLTGPATSSDTDNKQGEACKTAP